MSNNFWEAINHSRNEHTFQLMDHQKKGSSHTTMYILRCAFGIQKQEKMHVQICEGWGHSLAKGQEEDQYINIQIEKLFRSCIHTIRWICNFYIISWIASPHIIILLHTISCMNFIFECFGTCLSNKKGEKRQEGGASFLNNVTTNK